MGFEHARPAAEVLTDFRRRPFFFAFLASRRFLKARGVDASSRRPAALPRPSSRSRSSSASRSFSIVAAIVFDVAISTGIPKAPPGQPAQGIARGMTHSPRRLPSTMSERHDRRCAAPSLVHDRVLTDRPGNVETGARSTLCQEQAAPAARGQWIAIVLRGVSRRPRCWFGRRGGAAVNSGLFRRAPPNSFW